MNSSIASLIFSPAWLSCETQVKELQARYANNPEAANQAVQQLYQTENVNPLAGCLPAIAQIPIFISLYRCVRANVTRVTSVDCCCSVS